MNFYHNGNEICAIRPEKIEIADRMGSYDHIVRVKAVEFKGPLTRIHGSMKDFSDIYLDIPSEEAEELSLHEDSTMFLRMPQENLVRYSNVVM